MMLRTSVSEQLWKSRRMVRGQVTRKCWREYLQVLSGKSANTPRYLKKISLMKVASESVSKVPPHGRTVRRLPLQ